MTRCLPHVPNLSSLVCSPIYVLSQLWMAIWSKVMLFSKSQSFFGTPCSFKFVSVLSPMWVNIVNIERNLNWNSLQIWFPSNIWLYLVWCYSIHWSDTIQIITILYLQATTFILMFWWVANFTLFNCGHSATFTTLHVPSLSFWP